MQTRPQEIVSPGRSFLHVSSPIHTNCAGMARRDFLQTGFSAIGGLGLGSINDTGKRVSYPVSVGLRVDF